MVSQGADVNAKDNDGYTRLHCVASSDVEIVRYLVSEGADVNAKNDDGNTPFDLATIRVEDDKTKENAAVLEYLTGITDSQNL